MAGVRSRAAAATLIVSVLAAACSGAGAGGGPTTPGPAGTLPVIASTTVFADMVRNVGGDLVSVASLVPANADVHTFSPRPSDIRNLAAARLVVMNGLGLDDWLKKTIDNVATNAPVIRLAEDLPGADYLSGEDAKGPPNPHLWLDVSYAEGYADRIAAALASVDPAHAATYEQNRLAYRQRLATLDNDVTNALAAIPAANRRFVAFHDAFPYFARRYGLEIVGVAVPAPGQDPSAGYTAELVDAIRGAHVKAIFSEAQFPPKLVQQLASETGTTVVATLYDDSVGDAPVNSYEGIIRWDTDEFVKALS